MIVTQHPYAQRVTLDVIQEMVGKPLQITASQAAGIEVIEAWIRTGFPNPDLKLGEEVVSENIGDGIILAENLVEISPNPPVEASDHDVSIR